MLVVVNLWCSTKPNEKCTFGQKQLLLLVQAVITTALPPLHFNMIAIQKNSIPTDIQTLRYFLGMAGFYTRLLWNFSEKVKRLVEILHGGEGSIMNCRCWCQLWKGKSTHQARKWYARAHMWTPQHWKVSMRPTIYPARWPETSYHSFEFHRIWT